MRCSNKIASQYDGYVTEVIEPQLQIISPIEYKELKPPYYIKQHVERAAIEIEIDRSIRRLLLLLACLIQNATGPVNPFPEAGA
jgi:hypothetical protein